MKTQIPISSRIWPFLFLPVLILVPALYFNWHAIERDVASNVNQALAQSESWAKAETFNRGRDVLLTGTAPSRNAIANATSVATATDGVRTVDFIGDIAPASAPELMISLDRDKLILKGELDSEAAIEIAVGAAVSGFGADRVVNNLLVGENTAELNSLTELITVAQSLPEATSLNINGNHLTINGIVETPAQKASHESRLSTIFSGEIDNRLIVVPRLVERDICQDLLDQLLTNAKINFASGEASIENDSFQLIQSIADTANRCPAAAFEIAGYTDSKGSLGYNMALSQRRADSVMEAVVALGLDSNRFTAKGYGPINAGADNRTASGRAENRRIEFRLKN